MKHMLLAIGLAVLALPHLTTAAAACDRDELSERMDVARERLDHAADARKLDEAKHRAAAAQSALSSAASVLSLCTCWLGLNALRSAARSAQMASYADDSNEFNFELNSAIREFNHAVNVVNNAGTNSCELR